MKSVQSPAKERPWKAYWSKILESVLQPFLIDTLTVVVIVSLLWCVARLLILLSGGRYGVTPTHLKHATALLGLLYVLALLITVTRRLYYNVFKSGTLRTPTPTSGSAKGETDDRV